MNERMNKSIWSGVFFPADEPSEMELIAEDPMDAPLDVEVVSTDFQVEREDIEENTSVTNEVTESPEIVDESPVTEEVVNVATTETSVQSEDAVNTDVSVDNPEVTEE
jgi:hypothetical protein